VFFVLLAHHDIFEIFVWAVGCWAVLLLAAGTGSLIGCELGEIGSLTLSLVVWLVGDEVLIDTSTLVQRRVREIASKGQM
jgi:hypothetical protein